mgnify:CR=1 FL=1
MASILFIGEEYLKQTTPITENIDTKFIGSQITFAQDSFIQDILGEKLYGTLQSAYSAQTLDQYQTALILLIKPTLAYASAEAIIPFIHIQIKNKGTLNLEAESGKQSSFSDMKFIMEQMKNRKEFYAQRMVDYMVNNWSSFPDLQQSQINGIGIYPDTKSPYTCDLYTRDYSRSGLGRMCSVCGGYCGGLCYDNGVTNLGYSIW